jgi:hypothetical protein
MKIEPEVEHTEVEHTEVEHTEVEHTEVFEKIQEVRNTENIKRNSHTILPHFEMSSYYPDMRLVIKKKDPENGDDIENSYNICNYFLLSVAVVVVVVILATLL